VRGPSASDRPPTDGDRARSDEATIVLGVITRAHGVRGEVRVHRMNPSSTLLLELDRVLLREKDGTEREVAIRGRKRSGDADVLLLDGCTRLEDADALRGVEIAVPRSRLPRTEEDEHYHVDLIGLAVHEAGARIGEVAAVLSYPSADVLAVRTERGTLEVPILEPYVVAIDREAGTIEVAHTEDFEPVG
jgi:16S rRNA processing protein RimM